MWHLFSAVSRHLVIVLPVVMLAGFAWGRWFGQGGLQSLILPMTFVMIFPMLTTLNPKKLFTWGDWTTQLVTQAVNFAVLPFVALLIGKIFFPSAPWFGLGLFLAALLPTSGMTISWTSLAKGNLEAAVKMTVIGLTLGALATPIYLHVLMGTYIEFDMCHVVRQIVLVVFMPMLLGQVTRAILVRIHGEAGFKQNLAPKFSMVSSLGVLGIVFIALAMKAEALSANPLQLLWICVPVSLLYLFNYLLSTIVGKIFLTREDAIALVFGTVMRNLSIALAIALNSFGNFAPDVALVITIAFIIQVQSAAWYARLSDRIFGPPTGSR